jgi:hypothetical protein
MVLSVPLQFLNRFLLEVVPFTWNEKDAQSPKVVSHNCYANCSSPWRRPLSTAIFIGGVRDLWPWARHDWCASKIPKFSSPVPATVCTLRLPKILFSFADMLRACTLMLVYRKADDFALLIAAWLSWDYWSNRPDYPPGQSCPAIRVQWMAGLHTSAYVYVVVHCRTLDEGFDMDWVGPERWAIEHAYLGSWYSYLVVPWSHAEHLSSFWSTGNLDR